jgi:glycosyl-4,4'-diaponeurosporenoate acyltransferase
MPVIELRPFGVVVANVAFWALAHTASGYLAHRMSVSELEHDSALLRLKHWERGGSVYNRTVRIRRWKDRLPEAGAFFAGGMSKRTMPSRRDGGVERFAVETRRAELAHWMSLIPLPLCALWNPPAGVAVMALYGLGVNAPFILVQRYNRARCQRVLAVGFERSRGTRAADPGTERTNGRSIPYGSPPV